MTFTTDTTRGSKVFNLVLLVNLHLPFLPLTLLPYVLIYFNSQFDKVKRGPYLDAWTEVN